MSYKMPQKFNPVIQNMFNENDTFENLSKKRSSNDSSQNTQKSHDFKFFKNFPLPSLKNDQFYKTYRAQKRLIEDDFEKFEEQRKIELEKETARKEKEKLENSTKNLRLEALKKKYAKIHSKKNSFKCAKPIIKTFSRASKELDERKKLKLEEENFHLNFKFIAKEAPKSTRNPNLIKIKTEKLNHDSTTFSFVEKDRIRQIEKTEHINKILEEREVEARQMTNIFKALKPPVRSEKYVERMKELEEYRKIKKYLRMDTTLAESKLPFSNKYDEKGKIIF